MKGRAEKCGERHSELAETDISSLQQMATWCIDDHLIPPEDFGTTGDVLR